MHPQPLQLATEDTKVRNVRPSLPGRSADGYQPVAARASHACRADNPVLAVLLAFAALLGFGHSARSQTPEMIRHLPPVDATEPLVPWASPDGPQALLASDPREYRAPEELLPQPTSAVTGHKSGFFQRVSFTATEVFPDGSGELGIFETELFAAFALPAPTTEMPLLIVPTLEVYFPHSPSYVALPGTLYGPNLDLIWMPRFECGLQGMLSVAAGWYSDFQGEDDGFRLTGRGIARYDWVPDRMQLVLGVLYINRHDTKLVPAAGVIWKPRDELNFELVFPQAKLAQQLSRGPGYENWVYLSGGFGGNSWSVVNADDDPDVLILRDWRITAGWEQKRDGGAGFRIEVGYVFSRKIEFVSQPVVYHPDGTLLVRGNIAF